MADLPPLPPGFTLDQAPSAQGALPPLPPGFTLDSAQPQQPPSVMQQAGRQVGLAGRAAINGVAALPLMAMDAGVSARNLIGDAANKVMGKPATPDYDMPSQMFQEGLNQFLPHPETTTEKVTGAIESGLAGSKIMPSIDPAKAVPPSFAQNTKINTLKASQDAGYVVPPTTTNPTLRNMATEGFAGKAATDQSAAVLNANTTNSLAKQAVGIHPDAPLTKEALESIRSDAGATYAAISKAGDITADDAYKASVKGLAAQGNKIIASFPKADPGARAQIKQLADSLDQDKFDAGDALTYIQDLRSDAKTNLSKLNTDTAKQALGRAQKQAANILEGALTRGLKDAGEPVLADSLASSRELIAKTYSVQKALNPSTGNVSALKLAAQLNKNAPLSGELLTAAKFGQAFPKAAREVMDSAPGISPLDYYGSLALGHAHPLLYGLPAARMAARASLLSAGGQARAIPSQGSSAAPLFWRAMPGAYEGTR